MLHDVITLTSMEIEASTVILLASDSCNNTHTLNDKIIREANVHTK